MISVVGARKASDYGNCVARALSSAMSHIGFTIVSGGALGIDSSAHRGAFDEKGESQIWNFGNDKLENRRIYQKPP